MSKSRKKKGYIEKKIDATERRVKKAVKKKAKKVVTKGKQKAGNTARAAVDRARKKPADIIKEMRDSGWTPQQIQEKTGMSPRSQNSVLSGKSSGANWLQPLREARRSGKRQPPSRIKPVPSAKLPGAGSVRKTKTGTTITVSHTTSREWLAEQQRRARGKVRIVYTKTAKERGIGHTPPQAAPQAPKRASSILKDTPPRAARAKPAAPPVQAPKRYLGGKLVMSNADAFEKAVRGSGAAKTLTWYQQCKDLLKAEGGNVDAVMRKLGIKSKGTWRKWTHPDPKKRATPGAAMRAKIKEIRNSADVRKGFLPKRRMERFKKNGMKVSMHGRIAANADPRYERVRAAEVLLPPDAAERVIDALIEGGPEMAEEQFKAEMQLHYTANEMAFDFRDLDKFEMHDLDDFERASMEY